VEEVGRPPGVKLLERTQPVDMRSQDFLILRFRFEGGLPLRWQAAQIHFGRGYSEIGRVNFQWSTVFQMGG
jgi:hypothetical protein